MPSECQRTVNVCYVTLSLVVALAILFTGLLHDLPRSVIQGLLLNSGLFIDSALLVLLLIIFIFDGVAVHGQTVQVLEIGQKSHDHIDLILSLQVHVETSECWQSRN